MIGTTVHQYKILEKLGSGGMGDVYLADDTELNRKVALKFLSDEFVSDPEVLARFKREAQTAASLNHPNIITVYEVGQHGERPFIAMAYIEGQSLAELIADGDISLQKALDIVNQIGEGLSAAHEAGVVHRDIKPDNVFLEHNGRVKILDFGLAKLGGGSRLTGATSTFGTIYYMSPEQVRGEDVDARSDVFSFGVLLYEMLTGALPFGGAHSAAIIYSITNEDPQPLSSYGRGLSEGLQSIVNRALAKRPEDRYQDVRALLADLDGYERGLVPGVERRFGWSRKLLVPTSVVFAAVVLFVVFNPFRVEISPDQDAVAADHSLAIMYFENIANPDDAKRLGEIVTNLLITDLSESEYMDVVSGQRLYDILKLQGKEGEKVIDRSTATDVASRAGAKWMLLGSILQEEPVLIVTSQLVDVKTGKVAASQRITGADGEKIFSLVDKLTLEIKSDLSLPAAATRERDIPVAEATTQSTDAYRFYLEGMDFLNKYYGKEAKASFERAIEQDSTFAMAYLRLSSSLLGSSYSKRKQAIARAVQYADRVSTRERGYIESARALISGDTDTAIATLEALIAEHPDDKEAHKALGEICRDYVGDSRKAVECYRKAIDIDPMDKGSYNVLAYLYQQAGDIDNYIWAIYQYMSLAPDEANPYDSRGDLYAFSGKTGKAARSYEKALERKPDFYVSREKLGHMRLFDRQYDEARNEYLRLVADGDPMIRKTGRRLLALVPMHQGHMAEAIDVIDEAIAADRADGVGGDPLKYVLRADAYAAIGDYAHAIESLETGLEVTMMAQGDHRADWLARIAEMRARSGDAAGAEAVLRELDEIIEKESPVAAHRHALARGVVERENGDPAAACATFEKYGPYGPTFHFDYQRARAFLEANRIPEAISSFETIVRRYSEERANIPVISVMAHYYLGQAYEAAGRVGRAIDQYTIFLELWGDADEQVEGVGDARARLARLDRS